MKDITYSVFLVDDGPEPVAWDTINDHYFLVRDGAFIFYKTRPDEPSVVYPVSRFWVLKEE